MHDLPKPPPGCNNWRHAFHLVETGQIPRDRDCSTLYRFRNSYWLYPTITEYAAKEQRNQDTAVPPLSLTELIGASAHLVGNERIRERLEALAQYMLT